MIHALYVTAYPQAYFNKLVSAYPAVAMPASQRFNSLFCKGLIENGADLKVLCPTDLLAEKEGNSRKREKDIMEVGISYTFCPTNTNKYIRKLERQMFIRSYIHKLQQKYSDLIIFMDCFAPEAELIAEIGNQVCMIITDIPEFVICDQKVITRQYKMLKKARYFVPLTKDMMSHVSPSVPYQYCVMEGMVDDDQVISGTDEKKKIIMFSGSVHRDNGVDRLVEAFRSIDTDYELHVYGAGDQYVQKLEKDAKEDNRIKYFGLVTTEEILERQREASLLVNPRRLNLPYIKYSFPSKLLEYMASGTATISTDLSCFDDEYRRHLLLFKDDTVEGIREGLLSCISMGKDKLSEEGKKQQAFVLEKKNCKVQTRKVLDIMEESQV
ncbi:MAG: glycosyltransferase family 4 protein [Bulleidia sp.]|nr:glycosyltransferase family 4 protein [Bulleidia sp.]